MELLTEKSADLLLRARLPGHNELPEEDVEWTLLGYARLFPGKKSRTVRYLSEVGAKG